MKTTRASKACWLAFAALAGISHLYAQTWDTGMDPGGFTAITATSPNGSSVYAYRQDPGILGGERDMALTNSYFGGTVTNDTFGVFAASTTSPGNAFEANISRGASQNADLEYVWDGIDGSPAINYTGLGGVDLAASYSGIEFGVWSDYPSTTWTIYFYTDAENFSTFTVSKGYTPTIVEESFSPLFSEFTASGTSGGADFSNIGAIRITNTGGNSADTVLLDVHFTPIPEPTSLALAALSSAAFFIRRRK